MTTSTVQSVNHVLLAEWARNIAPSSLQDALARSADPTILSLSLGLPDPELFPMTALAEACSRVVGSNRHAFQYSLPAPKLKMEICRHMANRGVNCSPDQIFLTMGAQQGLSLLARLLLDRGTMIFEEAFSYTGFQQAVEPYQPRVVTIPTSAESGIDLDAVEDLLLTGSRPAFLYVMADGHNPLGATMPQKNRQRLADLARRFQVPVIEDDPYGFLEYDGTPLPPIRTWEDDWVYYVGSFSKLVAPSLRVGWLVVPCVLIQTLGVIKEGSDINMSSFAQWVIAEFLEMDALQSHLDCLRREYRARRQAMDTALIAEFPPYCHWRRPNSGVFFWVELPDGMNSSELLNVALEQQRVAFLPAEAFSRGQRSDGMRLNFSRCNPSILNEAVHRIANVVRATR